MHIKFQCKCKMIAAIATDHLNEFNQMGKQIPNIIDQKLWQFIKFYYWLYEKSESEEHYDRHNGDPDAFFLFW